MKEKGPLSHLGFVFSVVALCLSVYAAFYVFQMNRGTESDSFRKNIFSMVDAYIAEKNGTAPDSGTATPLAPIDISLDDDAVKGDENAPVTMVDFSDYECPFCGRFFNDTFGQISSNYIDKGKVKYVFRDFPLNFHATAIPAANAAECVREQSDDATYFAYHDLLFKNQTALGPDKLKEYAASLNIDQTKFAACMDEGKFTTEISEDTADGTKYGVRGTPAFFLITKKDDSKVKALKKMEIIQRGEYIIGYFESSDGEQMGLKVSGAHPYATFQKALDLMLQ